MRGWRHQRGDARTLAVASAASSDHGPPQDGRRRRAAGPRSIALGLLIAAALAAAPAQAGVIRSGGFAYVTRTFNQAPQRLATFAAPCPRGTHVYGGGERIKHADATANSPYVAHAFPYDSRDRDSRPDDGWRATTWVLGENTVHVYAICARPLPRYSQSAWTVDPGVRKLIYVNCPAGYAVVGGGSPGAGATIETSSWPFDGGTAGNDYWELYSDNYSSRSQTVTAIAICAKLDAVYPGTSGPVPPVTYAADSTFCPGDHPHVLGGGAVSADAHWGAARAVISAPFGFGGPAADGWSITLYNGLAPDTYTYALYAVCAPALS